MPEIKINKQIVNDKSLPFFISEVGSNHQGDVEHCKNLILASKDAGASAVKLKRMNKSFYSKELYNGHIITRIALLAHMVNTENT